LILSLDECLSSSLRDRSFASNVILGLCLTEGLYPFGQVTMQVQAKLTINKAYLPKSMIDSALPPRFCLGSFRRHLTSTKAGGSFAF